MHNEKFQEPSHVSSLTAGRMLSSNNPAKLLRQVFFEKKRKKPPARSAVLHCTAHPVIILIHLNHLPSILKSFLRSTQHAQRRGSMIQDRHVVSG